MPRLLRWILGLLLVLVVLALGLGTGGYFWWKSKTKVEAIPTQLPALADEARIAAIRVPGSDGLPDLVPGELRGKTVYFVLESKESMEAREGRPLSLALDRWHYPDSTRGYAIGEVEGLGLLKWKIDQLVTHMRAESRLPLYMDYQGAILRGFGLPKGHTGLIVLGPDGKLLLRHSGTLSDAEVEHLRQLLGASEPPAPAPAPEFALGPLSNRACAHKACALVFLARPVAVHDIPFIKGGFTGSPDEAGKRFEDPSLRLMTVLVDQDLAAVGSLGVFVGRVADDVHVLPGWTVVPDDARARAVFGIGKDEAAIVVVDDAGRLALVERGRVPMWKLAPLRVLLKLPPESS
jgi:predicted transcriptional regulator